MGPKAKSKITPTQRVPKPKLSQADVSKAGGVTYGKAKMKRKLKPTPITKTKFKNSYATAEIPVRKSKVKRQHKRKLRPSITPGTVLIILVGRHKGKRVVFLKQLASDLLLVTGPYIVNRVPMKRISQRYVIATSTKVDITGLEVPANVDDKYFKIVKEKVEHEKGDIFEKKKPVRKITKEKKTDQKAVDLQLIKAIKKGEESNLLMGYLKMRFSLSNKQYPHKMVF